MTEVLQQEIRTLRSVFESERDPEGRVFAPLADAYRRAGEVQQAVRLLNEGLVRHPQFVPGHVVAAQLYVEQGMVEEAGIAARHALELDGENVNALQSLLKVLEQNGDDEAAEVRDRLVSLDPRYQPEEAAGASATAVAEPPPLPQEESGAEDVLDISEASVEFEVQETSGVTPPEAEAEADTAPVLEGTLAESPFELEVDASRPELAPETSTAADEMSDEPLIDLDSLASVASDEVESEAPDIGMAGDLAPELEAELPTEEPVLDLDDLAPVEAAADGVDAELEAEPMGDVPGLSGEGYEEPVMDLADLGPSDAEPTVDLADLAPESEEEPVALADLAPEEPVMELSDLAPTEEDETVMDLAALAPEEPAAADEEAVDLADLAPEPEEAEEPVALADLAPEPEDEPVMELSDLAPTEEEETVMDLAALAPDASAADEEEAVDLADLAPATPEPEEEPVMELSDLAPAEEEDEPVAVADLAPEPEEETVALADLAPEPEDEGVTDLAALAPDEPVADEEEAVNLADLAPAEPEQSEDEQSEDEVTMVGLMAEAADTGDASGDEATSSEDVVVDMDTLRPAASETEAEEPEEATTDEAGDEAGDKAPSSSSDDDHEPGEPVYTRTLAELYVKQGAVGQAIEVYRHLASLDPEADDLRRRIEELESGEGLEEEPVLSEEAEEEVEALARELSQSGEEAHDEADSPFNLHGDAEEETPAEESSGPTIGDYFEGLLGWKPGQRP